MCHIDFGFMFSCFQAPKQWCWGTTPPLARILVIFSYFSIRPTDPVRNAFDVKRKRKNREEWPNPKPQTWRSKLFGNKTGPGSYSSNSPSTSHSENNCRGVKVSIHNMIVLETAIEILKVRLHWPFLVRFVLRFSARVKQDVLKKRSSFKFQVYFSIFNRQFTKLLSTRK